jgi:eukaryotic-like serine/threonine-protein kinase
MAPPVSTHPHTLGRFELSRQLGRGAQATVWLAHDPRLEREVAVKLMHMGASAVAGDPGLQEARSVSRLNHPNIVPLFEADVHEQQSYLVFEYVPGKTLADLLRSRGAMPPREAVELMLGVLEALQVAHDAGVVHRDLKPSNILLDAGGRARVMDFGIAARVRDAAKQQVVGTPGYMSPEATHGLAPTAAMDQFSAGLVLAELLCGKALIAEQDPYRAIYRTAHEDLALPASTPAAVDDALRAIVLRAIARDPDKRHASVAALREALLRWLNPVPQGSDAGAAGGAGGTLEFLLRRMRHKSDFPALSSAVSRIQKVANSDSESLSSLSGEILKDVALTNKLLRMVNTAHYSASGGGSISTVSRAVALVGFAGIRNMALSLVLLEHMHDKEHANRLKEEFLCSLMAGSLACELCPSQREGEEAFIGAMFQNLGRLLTEYYFPEEAGHVRSLVKSGAQKSPSASRFELEQSASVSVLGLGFEDLGLGVGKTWGLPDNLLRCMRRPTGEPPATRIDKAPERMRWVALAANEVTDAVIKAPAGQTSQAVAAVAERYTRSLGVSVKEMQAAALSAQERLSAMAQAMSLTVRPGSPLRRLLQPVGHGAAQSDDGPITDGLSAHSLQATLTVTGGSAAAELGAAPGAAAPRTAAADMLAAGIQDITNTMVEEFQLNQVLRMILETMLRALHFRRIVFCLRDAKTNALVGRFGLGEGIEQVVPHFKVALKPATGQGADLFSAVCLKGVDTLISDATVSNIASRLPAWFTAQIKAPAFLLLPLAMKGAPFALIYADKAERGGIAIDEKELSLLRTLRNQAVMAFKQSL